MLVGNNKSATTNIAGKLLAMSIVMQMRRYDVGHITR
jgi:hypothetical protein